MSSPKYVKYTYYDFHTETKGDVRPPFVFNHYVIELPSFE
jgi:hypothetical protein